MKKLKLKQELEDQMEEKRHKRMLAEAKER